MNEQGWRELLLEGLLLEGLCLCIVEKVAGFVTCMPHVDVCVCVRVSLSILDVV
jgi:hypothetical protein